MEFQIYDVSANSLSNFFNNNSKSICPSTFYNNSQYSLALDIMENDEYFNWNSASETKNVEPTILQHHINNPQHMMLNLSGTRKRKLLSNTNDQQLTVQDDNDSVIVDDSSDNSADSSLTGSHDSVIKGPPAKAIMLKTNVAVGQQHMILGHPKMSAHNGQLKKDLPGNGVNRMPQWQVEDIAELNADIEGSLHEQGSHSSAFNINDTILSISGMTVFKQEAPSPTSTSGHIGGHDSNGRQQLAPGQLVQCGNGNNQYGRSGNSDNNSMYNNNGNHGQQQLNNGYGNNGQQLQKSTHSPNGIDASPPHSTTTPNPNNPSNINHLQQADSYSSISSTNTSVDDSSNSAFSVGRDRQFQYILGAATSIATKMNEDTLTYLNQGQSYEIKLKPVLMSGGAMAQYRGKRLQSTIRVCFHERRLQYMEREQMLSWQRARPGDRILEMDVPLSYGATDVIQSSSQLNSIQFNWDPSKDTGAYIKVNCISTEFTPKKHGGEKGVPFRVQVATYDTTAPAQPVLLHAAACQVKVFKLKGADRKHKQDRDKVLKRPLIEQDKFQPSYEYTVLNEISSDAVVSCMPNDAIDSLLCESYSRNGGGQSVVNTPIVPKVNISIPEAKPQIALTANVTNNHINGAEKHNHEQSLPISTPNNPREEDGASTAQGQYQLHLQQLNTNTDPSQASRWLVSNRFERYLTSFANFSGADLLRMSRDDLMQVCGQADGIRLYNALHSKAIAPALTLYVSRSHSSPYHAIYLRNFSIVELQYKLRTVLSLTSECISAIYVQGPQGIHVHLEDAVLHHIKDETMFNVAILHNNNTENNGNGASFAVLLKPEIGGVKSSSFDDRN